MGRSNTIDVVWVHDKFMMNTQEILSYVAISLIMAFTY
ncbi:Uncharacterised protein [Legionella birminghamensis]|uniref:Uncharacterized protein n=1 Tax=Legionella birminghamensis TaxID=28083 RepID=A0A378IE48_9GAMM|nr:Uncharacterised protein [Legionella birminghamensis]